MSSSEMGKSQASLIVAAVVAALAAVVVESKVAATPVKSKR